MTLLVPVVLSAFSAELRARDLPPLLPAASLGPSGALTLAATPATPAVVLARLDGPEGGFFGEVALGDSSVPSPVCATPAELVAWLFSL